jgi:hypothetical protein
MISVIADAQRPILTAEALTMTGALDAATRIVCNAGQSVFAMAVVTNTDQSVAVNEAATVSRAVHPIAWTAIGVSVRITVGPAQTGAFVTVAEPRGKTVVQTRGLAGVLRTPFAASTTATYKKHGGRHQ